MTPAIWGTTYAVTALLLPDGAPGWMTVYRLLPAGLLLLLVSPKWLPNIWMPRVLLLGASALGLMFSVFVAAYRLPGGMAGTLIATLPLQTIILMWIIRRVRPSPAQILAALGGITGVAFLVLNAIHIDLIGILASFSACFFIFLAALKSKDWGLPEQGICAYVGWQLTFGGLLALPVVFAIEGNPPAVNIDMAIAFVWIGLIGAGWASVNWLQGILALPITALSFLSLVNPISAILCGQLLVGEQFGLRQWSGIALILGSIVLALKLQKSDNYGVDPLQSGK